MNNPGEINAFSTNQERRDMNPEKEKLREITERSKQFVVISGPSGSGKTMVIKHLVEDYGFIEPPFITTRKLRSGEEEIGAVSLDAAVFTAQEKDRKIFFPARNYGNAYGYYLDIIFNLVIKDSNIIVEAQASNLISDVYAILPNSTVIGMLPLSRKELEVQLTQRGLNSDEDRQIRLQNSDIEKEQIMHAANTMDIAKIMPTHGAPQDTFFKIDKLMEEKGFKKINK